MVDLLLLIALRCMLFVCVCFDFNSVGYFCSLILGTVVAEFVAFVEYFAVWLLLCGWILVVLFRFRG